LTIGWRQSGWTAGAADRASCDDAPQGAPTADGPTSRGSGKPSTAIGRTASWQVGSGSLSPLQNNTAHEDRNRRLGWGRDAGVSLAAVAGDAQEKIMIPVVKICGLKTEESIDWAVEAGAEMIGLVSFPPSPRHL